MALVPSSSVSGGSSSGGGAGGILAGIVTPVDPRLYNDNGGSLAANNGQLHRCVCPVAGTIQEVAIYVVTQAGNVDVGIYDCAATRNRLWSSGSVACPASGSWQTIGTANLVVTAGQLIELAYAVDNISTALVRFVAGTAAATQLGSAFTMGVAALPKLVGRFAAFPLPATIAEAAITAQQPTLGIIARIV